jgi:RNA polymerase sigma-70 factor (ECF subfamily)
MTVSINDTSRGRVLPDERLLFSQTQAGDQEAFRTIYRNHQVQVYWAAFSVLRSRVDAEEIVTDTFLTLWNKRASIEIAGESTMPWLVTTARYLAMNRRRAEQRRPSSSFDDVEMFAESPSPEDVAITREALAVIEIAMNLMPEIDQEIFRLCLVDDLSYKQAANTLGISHGSVRNRLSRLKNRLRSELDLLKRGK